MAEMVIPGTYITVRAEGLISAGRVSSGIVGVVGTAASGPVGTAVTLASFANAREVFGIADPFNRPEDGSNPLTLVRALEHIYNNGATNVIAVRVAGSSAASATYAVLDSSGNTIATLTATSPGTWANNMRIQVEPAEEDCRVVGETYTSTFNRLNYRSIVVSPENQFRVYRGVSRTLRTLDAVYKHVVRNEEVAVNAGGRYILTSRPVENVASVNVVRVLDSAGAVVRTYGDGDILYGAPGGPNPGVDEIRIDPATGEITFEASQAPSAGQSVVATYGVGHAAPAAGQILVTTWNGDLAFAAGEAPNAANGDRLEATYLVDQAVCARVTLRSGVLIERYTVPDGRLLANLIARSAASGRPSA
ncbi:MAG: hypothetical protein K8I30_03295, partial [Anaerolineae bacterium]|nr:hypothetical protein [Anaerolineae bacterium]